MVKFWQVFKYEYLKHVLKKRFIFALLSLPLFIVAIMLVSILAVVLTENNDPIGIVDLSGWLKDPLYPENEGGGLFSRPTEIYPYQTEADARQALESKEIQAVFVIEEDYLETRHIHMLTLEQSESSAYSTLRRFLRLNLLRDEPEVIVNRLNEGSEIVVRSIDTEREFSETNWFNLMVPIFVGVIFILVINVSGGYLLQAVVEEKENRTMEIIVTSISPTQLMAGKVAGNLSVGLTQLFTWAVFPLIAFLIFRNRIPFLSMLEIDSSYIIISLLTLFCAFIMVAALMAAVGATATEAREAQQVSGLFTLPLVVPYWLMTSMMNNPNGPLAVGLSIFPLTSPVSLSLRAAFTDVPVWQVALSLSLLVLCAAGAVWLAGKAFRLGMLRYGKRLSFKEIFRKA